MEDLEKIFDKNKAEKNICNVPFLGDSYNNNPNISDNILDSYYSLVWQPKTLQDISDEPYYEGKLNRFNCPYDTTVHGAYIFKTAFDELCIKVSETACKNKEHKDYNWTNIFTALKEYAKGFQYGFDNFIKDKIINKGSLSLSPEYKAQKIIDFLANPFLKSCFSESYEKTNIFKNWYDDGIIKGYHYCAWYFIFENHKIFEPLFAQFNDVKLQANNAALFIENKSSEKIKGSIYNEKKIGYKWQGKKSDLVSFFEELKNRKLIDNNTQLQDFLTIFSAGNLENIIKVNWLDTTTNLLFFILQMMEGDLIAKENRMNFERMRSCFSKRDNSPINDNLKEIKQQLIAKGLTINNRMITELIKQYY